MTEQELKVFLDQTRSFFGRLSEVPAHLGDTRVAFEAPKLLDFTGLIEITGTARGFVCLTFPRALLHDLLLAIGERSTSDSAHADLAGEVANIVASHARKVFGARILLSTPTPIMGATNGPALSSPVLVTPIEWHGQTGQIILALESA
ncbi:MAG: chemotaxis protein CheX [Verrucomicrobia bacterium]|nr:chemotaxis protein CheX [Verrucomicrobiota bacterium]